MQRLTRWAGRLLSLITAIALTAGLIDPRIFWLPAVFGPVLPLLLFLITSYTLLLAYKQQWKEMLLPLLIVILAIPAWKRTIALNTTMTNEVAKSDVKANDDNSESSISLITSNIATLKAPDQNNYPLNEESVANLGKRLSGADFFFVQEYAHKKGDWKSKSLQKNGQYPHVLAAKKGRLGIFSKYPLTHVAERFKYNIVNGFLVADANTPMGKIRLINIHLHSNRVTGMANQISKDGKLNDGGTWETLRSMFGRYGRASALRCEQADAIAKVVRESPYPCLLAGDFNDVPNAYPYRILVNETALKDAWIAAGNGLGKTFAGALPGLRIDYVLVDPTFSISSIKKLEPGHSDHHPLKVELAK